MAETVASGCRGLAGTADRAARPREKGRAEKYDAFAASRAALAASGTVALELALARVPMAVAYRLNRLTEALLDRIVKVRQVNLVNLLLGETLVPEHLRDDCTPEKLAASLALLIRDERVRSAHLAGYDEAMRRLRGDGASPSREAADRVLAIVAAHREDRAHRCMQRSETMTEAAVDPGKARLLHTMIRVKDLDKSLNFYTELLGMKLLRKRDYPDRQIHAGLCRLRRRDRQHGHRADP